MQINLLIILKFCQLIYTMILKKYISNAATNSFPNINIKFVFGIIKDQKKNKK